MMNIFFLGLEHLKWAGFPFQFMAQKSEVILEGTLNFLTYSNNVSKGACKTCGKTWTWNPIPWNFIQHQQYATTKPYKISLGIIIYGSYSFFSIAYGFFPRPSPCSDPQRALTEKHTARTYFYLFLYVLVYWVNWSINYFPGRPPFQILFTSSGAHLPFSSVYWMEEKTENVVWVLEEAQLSIMLWNKFPGRVLQVSHWKHLRCSRECIKRGAAENYLNLTDGPDDLKRGLSSNT